MNLIKATEQKISYSKTLLFGETGTGKSTLAAKLAIGLIKTYDLPKHIVFYDTERRAKAVYDEFVKPEKIEMEIVESRSLQDLYDFICYCEEKEAIGIIDNATHVWQYVMENYLYKVNQYKKSRGWQPQKRLYLNDWIEIKPEWVKKFDAPFTAKKCHLIQCARAKNVFEEELQNENDPNSAKLKNVGSAPRTESNSAFEPYLIIELFRDINTAFENNHKLSKYIYSAVVAKDNFHAINGRFFNNPSFENFDPHFKKLNINDEQQKDVDLSGHDDTFDYKTSENKDDGRIAEKKKREILLEEIKNELFRQFPGQTKDDKLARMNLCKSVFNTDSWVAVENKPIQILAAGHDKIIPPIEDTVLDEMATPKQIVELQRAYEKSGKEIPAKLSEILKEKKLTVSLYLEWLSTVE